MTTLRVILALALAWAVLALAVQVLLARGGGRRDFSRPVGDPRRGLLYNFTTAMLPSHKESARFHPLEFGAGIVLHAGVFAALLAVLLLLGGVALPAALSAVLRILAAAGCVSGLGLLVRRARSPLLRAISVPDDYLSAAITTAWLLLASMPGVGGGVPLLVFTTLLFVYLPLGKLRHAVFFFVARGDYGWRLGYRGVYPPATADARST